MDILRNILLFVLLLGIIITIHEAGHLIAAKIFNVYCGEFSIGMGPKLYSHKFKETTFSLRAIPIGGYVAMAGDNDNKLESDVDETDIPLERTLKGINPVKKIIVMLAGIIMNLFLALFIISMLYACFGEASIPTKPTVKSLTAGYPAETVGIKEGDIIIKCELDNGNAIEPDSYNELSIFLGTYTDGPINLTINRNGEIINFSLNPKYSDEENRHLIGVEFSSSEVVEVNIINCWKYGFIELKESTKLLIITLLGLFRGVGYENLSGPVGIYQATGLYVSLGIAGYLYLVALLSLNVGIFNSLPLPVMDGGRVVITLIECIIRKPLDKKIEKIIMSVSVILLLLLLVFVTFQDIFKLFN